MELASTQLLVFDYEIPTSMRECIGILSEIISYLVCLRLCAGGICSPSIGLSIDLSMADCGTSRFAGLFAGMRPREAEEPFLSVRPRE